MNFDHKIFTETAEGRDYWECSCGAAGSAPEEKGDLASDRHIKPDESRADISQRQW